MGEESRNLPHSFLFGLPLKFVLEIFGGLGIVVPSMSTTDIDIIVDSNTTSGTLSSAVT